MAEITKHSFVPKHTKLTPEEVEELLKIYNITLKQLPKISSKDPAIRDIEASKSDVFKIIRVSKTNKEAAFYRVVVNE
ncbi:DNA-directed RNA polymerase subunit H [Candidatus Woesearchaeota archaeon]|nr:DNA-directed RNA polymerase subunit H [Candidatus Woesearchaeota archaeon]